MIEPEARANLGEFTQSRHQPFHDQPTSDGFLVTVKTNSENSGQSFLPLNQRPDSQRLGTGAASATTLLPLCAEPTIHGRTRCDHCSTKTATYCAAAPNSPL